ncbi:AraC family transcriptional regulator [Paenibacillus amylolyticus]|uniref:AraC family transcriptional regulator n=1 Tax=Paenibacillus amylolyticus TaxID=1451 RepID=A0A1R1C4F1_PAEAM|nr:AraC family transcriptional regulator [Paenibacillus amylolyticus]OMF16929.1 AraC family transcriptional regulator [Paenibacillus amylolyticus]
MIDVDQLANTFASSHYEIHEVNRLVIQPRSILREFKTLKYGFLFVMRGEARMTVNGTIYELQSGSVFHAAPGMKMDSRVISETEYEYYAVFYGSDKIDEKKEQDVHNALKVHFKMDQAVNPRIVELLAMLQEHAYHSGGMEKLRVKQLFLSILVEVLMGYRQRESVTSPSEQVIEEALSYINVNYMNPLTLDELAETHGMNSKQFSYFFHKYTGLRPIDYVIHHRMERARDLLKSGNFLIRDVAISVGYPNPLYFSRVFKNKFGVSPSAYADQLERH